MTGSDGESAGVWHVVCHDPDCDFEELLNPGTEPEASHHQNEHTTATTHRVTRARIDSKDDTRTDGGTTEQPVQNREWIADQLAAVPVVTWDRFTVETNDGSQLVEVYGWIHREEDAYKDFVLAAFWPEQEAIRYTTSSDVWTEYLNAEWLDEPRDEHIPCRRVEDAFGIENAVELTDESSLDEYVTDGGRETTPGEWCDWCQHELHHEPEYRVHGEHVTALCCSRACARAWRASNTGDIVHSAREARADGSGESPFEDCPECNGALELQGRHGQLQCTDTREHQYTWASYETADGETVHELVAGNEVFARDD